MTAAKAAPLPIPNVPTATAMASSKLLPAAVKATLADKRDQQLPALRAGVVSMVEAFLAGGPASDDVNRPGDLPIVEVPVSVALTHRLPRLVNQAYVYIPRATRLRGLLSRDYLRIVDFAWLYPVRFDEELMAKAASTLVASGSPVLNVFFHSSELVPGASGRVRTEEDVEAFFRRLRAILEHCLGELGAAPATLAAAGRTLRPSLGLDPRGAAGARAS